MINVSQYLESVPLVAWLSLPFVILVLLVINRGGIRWQTLKNVRGPKSDTWLYGHQVEFYRQTDVGELDFTWANQYGGAWKIDGCLGVGA